MKKNNKYFLLFYYHDIFKPKCGIGRKKYYIRASTKLNKLLQTETKQYRTSKKVQEPGMCFPQYKYINNNRYIFNGKTSSWSGLGAYYLTSKLC